MDGVMGSILSKVRELLKEEYILPTGDKERLKRMTKDLRRLHAYFCYMEDAPLRNNKRDFSWIKKTRELVYLAENLMDSLMVLADCCANTGGFKRLFEKTRDSPNPPLDLLEQIEHIIIDATSLLDSYKRDNLGAHLRAPYDYEKKSVLVGIDGPRDMLIKRLVDEDDMSKKQMKIVSIVGAGGLGKSTLAGAVYRQLIPQFDCGAFVTVPLESSMGKVFQEMLSQLSGQNHMIIDKEEDQLTSQIKVFLRKKRYLVVIDDLCNEDDWHSISCSLPRNDFGSSVITITRFNDIANLCCSGCEESRHDIQHLGYLDSKELFFKEFVGHEVSPTAPIDVFNDILKMCGGTPSAIISIASMLAARATKTKSWNDLMNTVHSAWEKSSRSVRCVNWREMLSVVYAHLPSTQKNCLLYLTVQSKNQMIHRTTTVRKWIAEGFIPEYVGRSREEVASQYFDELIDRNFIQLEEYDNCLGTEIYEANYYLLALLRIISHGDDFATIWNDDKMLMRYNNSIRLSIQCSGSSDLSVHIENMDASHVRSITIVGPAKLCLTNDIVYLRVLDLDGCKDLNNSAMDYICRMIRLKYLSLKHTQVTEIPPEIGKLRCLETLDLRQSQVKELPKDLFELPKLAHLYYGRSCSPRRVKLPVRSNQWTSLKLIGTVDSREWSGRDMEEISWQTEVRELEVVLHDQPADKYLSEKLLASLAKCKNLEYLIIDGDYNPSNNLLVSPSFPLLEEIKVAGRFVKVPRWIAQLTTLKKLDVRVCKLDQDDLKILGGLPGLNTLVLALICIPRKKEVAITSRLQSSTCTDLPPLEERSPAGFTSLEVFSFDCRVPWITFEQGAMPVLKQLHLKLYAFSAGKFPSGITNLHSLEKIILQYSTEYASNGGVTKAVAAVKEAAASHGNRIKLSVNGDEEVFVPNTRVDQTITGTEIEEVPNHGNGIVRSINGDPEVLVTRVDESITGTETEEASNHGNQIEPSVDGDREVLLSNTRVDETVTAEIKECY